VRIIWSEIAQATFVRFMADQAGMMAVNRAVEALADDPAPPGAFVRGAYRRLRVGPYRVLYEVEGDLITENTDAAAFSMAVAAGGAVKAFKTTPLLSVEEGVEAMRKAQAGGIADPADSALSIVQSRRIR
jgi:hypothetical protein